jgi:hypothetical protein
MPAVTVAFGVPVIVTVSVEAMNVPFVWLLTNCTWAVMAALLMPASTIEDAAAVKKPLLVKEPQETSLAPFVQ